MYTVEEIRKPSGKGAVIVKRNHKLVGAASLHFVRWMHDHVPTRQLSPEQAALVAWFDKQKSH